MDSRLQPFVVVAQQYIVIIWVWPSLVTAIVFDAWHRPYSLWRLVSGDHSIDRHTYLLSHFPWRGTLASMAAAVSMLLVSVRVVQRREF
jgi:hypothetical protein